MSLQPQATRHIAFLAFVCVIAAGTPGGGGHRGAPPIAGQSVLTAPPVDENWPQLIGRVGPYGGINADADAHQMLAAGLSLAVTAGLSSQTAAVLNAGGGRYIDNRPWSRLYAVCRLQYAVADLNHQPRSCTLSPADESAIATQVSADLLRSEGDPALAGFWVLDDDPHGDVNSVLARIHALVAASNVRSRINRPTVCGVGGVLDHKRSPSDASFAPDRQSMVSALRNVSPAGCDLVAPYFYGAASTDDPSLVDWSLQDLLPFFELAVKGKGYPSPADVLLPLVDAFSYHAPGATSYYVKPRADDVLAQMHAYCAAGASSVLFFTWRSQDADTSYANDSDLQSGVQRGRADCLQQWRLQRRQ